MPADAPAPTPMVTLPRAAVEDMLRLCEASPIGAVELEASDKAALRAALDAPMPAPCEHGADDCNAAYYRREWESACERVAASGCREDEAKADLSYAIRRAEKAEAERDALLKVPGNRLEGYRELGAKVAAAEAARDEALGKARFWAGLKPALDNERAYHAAARERVAVLEGALARVVRQHDEVQHDGKHCTADESETFAGCKRIARARCLLPADSAGRPATEPPALTREQVETALANGAKSGRELAKQIAPTFTPPDKDIRLGAASPATASPPPTDAERMAELAARWPDLRCHQCRQPFHKTLPFTIDGEGRAFRRRHRPWKDVRPPPLPRYPAWYDPKAIRRPIGSGWPKIPYHPVPPKGIGESSKGRTADFESADGGSTPPSPAISAAPPPVIADTAAPPPEHPLIRCPACGRGAVDVAESYGFRTGNVEATCGAGHSFLFSRYEVPGKGYDTHSCEFRRGAPPGGGEAPAPIGIPKPEAEE